MILSFTFSFSKIDRGLQHAHANPVQFSWVLVLRVCGHEREACARYVIASWIFPCGNWACLKRNRSSRRKILCYPMRLTHVSAQGPQVVARTIYLDVHNNVQDTLHKHLQYTIHYLHNTQYTIHKHKHLQELTHLVLHVPSSCFEWRSSSKLCFIQNLEIGDTGTRCTGRRIRYRIVSSVSYRLYGIPYVQSDIAVHWGQWVRGLVTDRKLGMPEIANF